MASVYIHIPFCMQKCPYCDFSSFDDKAYLIDDYINAIGVEAEYYKKKYPDVFEPADVKNATLYVGGGTPSFLSYRQLDALFTQIYRYFPKSFFSEITIEANPETLNENKAKVMALNVNRASLGCQSFDDNLLKTLGRPHDSERAKEGAGLLKKHGIENLNIDLIFGIPGQTVGGVRSDIREAVSLGCSHISFYSLTAYEHTPFYSKKAELPGEEDSERLYTAGCAELKAQGFGHYEISNFAKPGRQCRHNLAYWNLGEYIGIGAAASSYFKSKRYTNTADAERYISLMKRHEDSAVAAECIDDEKMVKEYIMLKLRTAEGVSYTDFTRRFGFDFKSRYSKIIGKYSGSDCAQAGDEGFKLTEKGFFVSNSIISSFF